MKYENIKRAKEICDEIEGHEKLLAKMDDNHYVVSVQLNRKPYDGVFHAIELKYETNEDLKFLATDYRNKVAQYYRNRIESLKTELEKL